MKREIYRPLRIVHGNFGYRNTDPYEEKCRCVRARIEDLKAKGFGGIVTNVGDEDYLQNADEWKLMGEKARICKELGLRMWLYDEKAYPSGAAGTLTLDKNPDYEARGLVMVSHILMPGESLEQALPYGHEKLVSAVCYEMEGDAPTEEELLHPVTPAARNTGCAGEDVAAPAARVCGDSVRFENLSEKNLLCLAFYAKHLYEGTHAQNNVAYHRRYVDVSNPEAIAAFIDNTYRPYTEAVGRYYAESIGDEGEESVIEAIFTDEPSYMGVYINDGIECPTTVHEVDRQIKLYPLVNWGKNVTNRFYNKYGYRLEEELTALFLGHGEHFCQVRHDYYQLMSDLYEQAFFAQLSDYCAQAGLQFSGHILLEDDLPLHVMFEGNFFKLLRHMHVPGIDMLFSTPETVWKIAFTPLLVRSIAELYGRTRVMDEASAHAHGGKVTREEMYVSLMLQLAFGADTFTFYYSDEDPEGWKQPIYDALNRAGEAIAGKRLSDTLLFYPIETMMRRRKPLYQGIENCHEPLLREQDDDGKAYITACNEAMLSAQYAMLNAQKPFTYIDADTASRQNGQNWKNLVVSACDVTDEMEWVFGRLARQGVQVIWYAPEGSQIFEKEFEKMPAGTKRAASPSELLALVRPEGPALQGWADGSGPAGVQDAADDMSAASAQGADAAGASVSACGSTDGIAFAETENCALLVNRDPADKKLRWNGAFVSLTDAWNGEAVEIAEADGGVTFLLPGSGALILRKK